MGRRRPPNLPIAPEDQTASVISELARRAANNIVGPWPSNKCLQTIALNSSHNGLVVDGGSIDGVRVTGWQIVDSTDPNWSTLPAAGQGKIVKASLTQIGITGYVDDYQEVNQHTDPASWPISFFHQPSGATEVEELAPARWPETGWAYGTRDAGNDKRIYNITSNVPAIANTNGLYLIGHPSYGYGNEIRQVLTRTSATEIRTANDFQYTSLNYTQRKFFLVGRPEFLTNAGAHGVGQCWVDRSTGIVYAWFPTDGVPNGPVWCAPHNGHLVTITGANNITIRNVTIRFGRNQAIVVNGSNNVLVEDNNFSHIRNTVMYVGRNGSTDSLYFIGTGNTISKCGSGALGLKGGDRKLITKMQATFSYNTITDIQRYIWKSAIQGDLEAYTASKPSLVGVTISYNDISNIPFQGITTVGAFSYIGYNTLTNCVHGTVDVGAIYNPGRLGTVGDPSISWGTIIEHNTIIDCYNSTWNVGNESIGQNAGIYCDDGGSGMLIRNNYINGTGVGILIGGGSYNYLNGNTIVLPASATIGPYGQNVRWLTWDGRFLPNSWAGDGATDITWRTSTDTGHAPDYIYNAGNPGIDVVITQMGFHGSAWTDYCAANALPDPASFVTTNNRHKIPINFLDDNTVVDPLERSLTSSIFSTYPSYLGGIGEQFTNAGVVEDYVTKIGAGVTPTPVPPE